MGDFYYEVGKDSQYSLYVLFFSENGNIYDMCKLKLVIIT